MEKPVVLWHRWRDPMAHLVKEPKHDDREHEDALRRHAQDTFVEEEEGPVYEKDRPSNVAVGPGIMSPMGIIPLHEENLPGKLFTFWVGHTTVDLTRKLVRRIAVVPGVETLDVWTRYRFRLGIGKAFKPSEVKKAVEQVLVSSLPAEPAKQSTAAKEDTTARLQLMMKQRYKAWAIYRLPGGQVRLVGGSSREEVESKGSDLAVIAKEVITSW